MPPLHNKFYFWSISGKKICAKIGKIRKILLAQNGQDSYFLKIVQITLQQTTQQITYENISILFLLN